MEPDKETSYFKQVSFFADLPEEEIQVLSSATKPVSYTHLTLPTKRIV